jgi:O-acetylhomoserine (thiol)-lyase
VFDDPDYAAQLFELKQYGNIYTRIMNPTTAVFEERMASLEGGTGAVATASGMAAQFLTFYTLLQPGDEIVSSAHLYGGTTTQFTHTFQKMGVTVKFVDPSDFAAWERAITPKNARPVRRDHRQPERLDSGHRAAGATGRVRTASR